MAPVDDWRVFHASTYDSNPLSLLMASEVINELKNGIHFEKIQHNIDKLSTGVKNLCQEKSINCLVQRSTAFFSLYFTELDQISNYTQAMTTDYTKYSRFVKEMFEHKIIVSEGELQHANPNRNWIGSWFMSSAHTDEQLDSVLKSVDIALNAVKN